MWWLWPWYAGRSAALAPALQALGLHGTSWALFVGYHALVNPWIEEIYWRGALGERRGLVRPSDAGFAAYHAIVLARFTGGAPILLSLVVLTGVAASWRWTLRRTGSLWPAILGHLAADAGIMWVVFRMAG